MYITKLLEMFDTKEWKKNVRFLSNRDLSCQPADETINYWISTPSIDGIIATYSNRTNYYWSYFANTLLRNTSSK